MSHCLEQQNRMNETDEVLMMYQTKNTVIWPRAIILIDMNAFFASVEQLDHPEWQGRALAVTNGKQGTCIITSSYEARAYGIKTGMRLQEAKKLCRHLIQVPARPERYVEISRAIMKSLTAITPDIEIFSVDEAFLDVTHCQLLHGSPEKMGLLAKQIVFKVSGLLCSVGVSGDKTTAKYAAKLQKPNGFVVIPPWEAKETLRHVNVTELSGIKSGIGGFLKKHGATTCGEVERIPISILSKRFGNIGKRIWYMCQGADPEPVHTMVASPKSMGHGKVMPPNTTDRNIIETFLMHMCEKLGARLRQHQFHAQHFFAGLLNRDTGWYGSRGKTIQPTHDSKEIYQLAQFIIDQHWNGEPISQVQVTALDPREGALQLDLFVESNEKREITYSVIDEINHKYGEFTIAPAQMLHRSQMPNVIAPAWKPDGHRQTI
ncbi:MAG: DNA polymerase IV [Gammaproteobacteria bacterium]|nr:DNA polymerase IV [Gammaproteobacteria bacterium]